MKSEDEPIADDEWLLRRIPRERFRSEIAPLISPNAFEPRTKGRDPDIDGISFYRELCLHAPTDVLATIPTERWDEYGIARISVTLLRSLGFSAISQPDPRIVGHVVIPEMNARDYAADKGKFVAPKLAIAEEASKNENIVRWPRSR